MDWPDYFRDQATQYRRLAEKTEDPVIKQELLDLAEICEEVANDIRIVCQVDNEQFGRCKIANVRLRPYHCKHRIYAGQFRRILHSYLLEFFCQCHDMRDMRSFFVRGI